MKKNYLFSVLTTYILIAGCSGDQKRGNDVFERISLDVNTASQGLLKFNDFEKLDGKEIQSTNSLYELEFKGFISAEKNCCWEDAPLKITSSSDLSRGIETVSYPLSFKISNCVDITNQNFTKVGWGYKVLGKAYFEKRDSGWKLLDYVLIDSARVNKLAGLISNF
ncbi:hypothetical protein [Pedobacter ghigonis]|uniref:hypothetical protein n=1 Tax=Pedobacter ghigonis TaxID=2730403 RepID=UPI00158F462F|nr:hypothetical protein [Pedobacter ghigonis]